MSELVSEAIVLNFQNFKLCKIPVKVQDEIEATIVLYGEFEKLRDQSGDFPNNTDIDTQGYYENLPVHLYSVE